MEFTSENMIRFKDLIYSRTYLSFSRRREDMLRRWILQRATAARCRSLDDYQRLLISDEKEFEQLIALITTRVTYFFRMPGHFETLADVVLPEIAEREGKKALRALASREPYRMRLRVWSAGCATGQEPYSLSIQILDTIRYTKAWDLKVLGTDINADALAVARAGRYSVMGIGKMPAQFVERYFEVSGLEEISLSEEVRGITEFETLNLRNLPDRKEFKHAFDIIFCRNVMIYFDQPAQQRLVTALWESLAPGGYLFTGEGEVLHITTHAFEVKEWRESVFYRRPEAR
jgi:chemotaxis protein methyltransferase CheR